MERCEFKETCPFLNEKVGKMPLTTQKLVEHYCEGDFTMCMIHGFAKAHGIDNVPKYVYPDDKLELPSRYLTHIFLEGITW
jgi:hypothetical protein